MQISYEQLLAKMQADLAAFHATNAIQQITNKTVLTWASVTGAFQNHWLWLIIGALVLIFLMLSAYTIRTQEFAMIERFGKYRRTAGPGIHFKIPLVDRIRARRHLRIDQLDVKVETITIDKVSIVLTLPVQYAITPGREWDAVYKLENDDERMESVVFDEVRSRVPKLTLDQVFNSKDDIATEVKTALQQDMGQYGYDIDRVLVTEVEPDAKVKSAMNDINAAQKEGEAQLARANNEQKVQVSKAHGRLEAAQLNKAAEIIDAEAVAKSVEIIGTALHNNHGFLQWKWIHMMEERDSGDTIYVPTEAGLPILEAGKRMSKTPIE